MKDTYSQRNLLLLHFAGRTASIPLFIALEERPLEMFIQAEPSSEKLKPRVKLITFSRRVKPKPRGYA